MTCILGMRAALVVTVLASAAALTACGSDGAGQGTGAAASAGSPVAITPVSPNASVAVATPSVPPSSGSADGDRGSGSVGSAGGSRSSGTCLTSNLGFGYGPDSGAQSVGSPGAVVVKLTNRGSSTCAMKGFPGVDLETDSGVISVPRTKHSPVQVTLKPGGSTVFALNYMPNTSGGTGIEVSTMVITPPNETHSHSMPWEYQSLPVTNGEGSAAAYPNVDPVGFNG